MSEWFERLHPNHKFAFLDGFLCGLVTAKIAYEFYQDYQEDKQRKKRIEESYNQNVIPTEK